MSHVPTQKHEESMVVPSDFSSFLTPLLTGFLPVAVFSCVPCTVTVLLVSPLPRGQKCALPA